MFGFLLWCGLFIMCWPLALAALFLYPIVWLILLPFRIVGIAVGGVLELVWVNPGPVPAREGRPCGVRHFGPLDNHETRVIASLGREIFQA